MKIPCPSGEGLPSGSGNRPGINISGWHLPWFPQTSLGNSGEMCFGASLLLLRSFCIFSFERMWVTWIRWLPRSDGDRRPSASLVSCPWRFPSFCGTLVGLFWCLGCLSGDVLFAPLRTSDGHTAFAGISEKGDLLSGRSNLVLVMYSLLYLLKELLVFLKRSFRLFVQLFCAGREPLQFDLPFLYTFFPHI